jgi:hypothetical protein
VQAPQTCKKGDELMPIRSFTVAVNMDGPSFEADPCGELRRVLQLVSDQIVAGNSQGSVLDSRGYTVGRWQIVGGRG